MKHSLIIILLSISLILPTITYSADRLDSDGYPVMYLRGEKIGGGWGDCNDTYRFDRDGDRYTLVVEWLDGYFKVSGTDWKCNYGAIDAGVAANIDATIPVVQDGHNILADKMSMVEISFILHRDGLKAAPTDITFKSLPDDYVIGLSGSLPVLYVNVFTETEAGIRIPNNEIIDKDLSHKDYFGAEYWLDVSSCQWALDEGLVSVGTQQSPLAAEIKARGNYTRTAYAKKPFKLKLGKSQNLLGLTPDKSKHYTLLAHADDNNGYLRNFVGFNLAQRIGLPWTPSMVPVELVINGNYRGLYFLTESIRVGDGRIEIDKLKDNETDPMLISGGYIVELDNYDDTYQIRLDEQSCVKGHKLDKLRVTFDTPEEYSDLQRRFITDQFTAINNSIGNNTDDTWRYIDLDDAVRYYIVKEVISDVESYHGSCYLFRNRGEGHKWHFSPMWDCGQAFNGPTDDFFYNRDPYGNTWIPSLRENPTFNAKLRQTWLWFVSSCYPGIIEDIECYVSRISAAALADRTRWKDTQTPNGGVQVCDNSDMQSRMNAVIRHLDDKVSWLCDKFGRPEGPVHEPLRDTTEAAPIPSYAGLQDLSVDSLTTDSEVYFTISGILISEPHIPGIYIRVDATGTSKLIIK